MNRCTTCGAERMHGLCHPGVAKPASTYGILSLVFKASAPRDPRSAFPPHYDLAVSDMDRDWQFADGERDSAKNISLRRCHALEERRCNGENHPTQCYPGGESPRLESEVLRKLLNDAVPAQMDLKVGDTKSSSEMRALVVSSASPSREP